MNDLGRIFVLLGLALLAIGAAILLLGKTGLPLGRLPGDISWRGKNTSFYFPLGTCLLLSLVLSLVLWILARLRK